MIAARRASLPFVPPQFILPFDPSQFVEHGLRDYQIDLLFQVVACIQDGYRRILIQLPTGGGKTKIATALLSSADAAHFVVHRKELIEQTSRAFWRAGIGHGFVAADKPTDSDAEVLLCGIATLTERLGLVLPPEIVLWDEVHHSVSVTWAKVMHAHPDALHIGLTATPQRLDGRGLGELFEVLVLGPSVKELISRGFLSDFDYYGPPFDPNADASLIGDVVEHYQRHAAGQQGIIFASSRDHSRSLVDAFVGSGVRAIHMDGAMATKQRERADIMFRNREIDLLCNVNLAGEGYDVPGIVYCGIARRTQSLAWFLQMVGRAIRPVYAEAMPISTDDERLAAIGAGPKPRGIICDHGGNWMLHGMPDDDRAWSLEGKVKGSGCNSDASAIKQCLACYRVVPSVMKICSGCGTEFPAHDRTVRQADGTLIMLEREEAKRKADEEKQAIIRRRRDEERACRSEGEFVTLAQTRGYEHPRGWARQKIKQRNAWKRG